MTVQIRRYHATVTASSAFEPLLARIYSHRGVNTEAELDYGLAKLPEPAQMRGMTEAVELLITARKRQLKTVIIGDFDADGATATALALRGLTAMGFANISFMVPNRFTYGYGLTEGIVREAHAAGAELIITVDNGIANIEGVALAKQLGMHVLITDHHLPAAQLPVADAIVNPNQPHCPFPDKSLAGVGVMFYVLMGLRQKLRELGEFDAQPAPNLAQWLDLVALGTVADVVPLSFLNRLLVAQGLQRIRRGQCSPGIQALAEIGNRSLNRLVAQDFGFVLGPRLNAAGRLDDMSFGILCLITDNLDTARDCARELNSLNVERQGIEGEMLEQAMNSSALTNWQQQPEKPWTLCLFDPQWHQGVIGIVAGRLRERFHRPAIIFAPDDTNPTLIKGSARSIVGLHMRDLLDAVAKRAPNVIEKFGGHAMAAGLTIQRDHFEQFCQVLEQEVRNWLNPTDLEAVLWSDGELVGEELSIRSAELLRQAGPWGQRFPEPAFDGEFEVLDQRLLKDAHLKLQVKSVCGQPLEAIAFRVDRNLWPNYAVRKVRLLYQLDVNEWNGVRRLQLLVRHIEPIG